MCIRDREYSARMINASSLTNHENSYINSFSEGLLEFTLLIIDDLGSERNTEYAIEKIYNCINARYEARKPMIITTNISLEMMKNPENINKKRLYDRILERCAPVKYQCENKRKHKQTKNIEAFRALIEEHNTI